MDRWNTSSDEALGSEASALGRWLAQIEEPELRVLVRDLLTAMRYQRVAITHGTLEFGRDLVFAESDPLGREIWRGVQVKAQPLSGSLDDAGTRTLITQCEASLAIPFVTPSGSEVRLTEIWVVNSKQLSEQAKLSIRGKLTGGPGTVEIVDGPRLLDLVQRHLPHLLRAHSAPLEEYLSKLRFFCDTPEDYLSARFGTQIPLSRCYVAPIAYLTVVKPERLRTITSASEASGLAQLAASIPPYQRLAEGKLLWHSMQARVLKRLRRLRDFQVACADTSLDLREDVNELGTAIAALANALKIGTHAEGWQENPDLSVNVVPATLEKLADDFLRSLAFKGGDYKALDPLRHPRRTLGTQAKRNIVVDRRKAHEEQINAIASFETCYKNLAEAYLGKPWADETFAPVCAELARHLLTQIQANDAGSPPSGVGQAEHVSKIVDRIVARLLHSYAENARLVFNADGSAAAIADEHMDAALALSQSSDVLNILFDFQTDSLTRLDLQSLDAVSDRVKKIALIGDLGLGKSTTLKRLAHKVIARKPEADPTLPVFVVLAALSPDLAADARTQLFAAAKYTFAKLDETAGDHILWLLDGLDEMQSEAAQQATLKWMLGARDDAPKRAWLTSRPASLTQYVPGLRKIRLAPFDPVRIEEFISKFPWTTASAPDSLRAALADSKDIAQLAQMPLLLSLLALLSDFEDGALLPRRREGIYEGILNLFMGDWDRAKGIRRVYSVRDKADRFQILGRTALDLYARRRRSFSREDFVSSFAKHVQGDVEHSFAVAEASVKEMVRDSLIVEQPGGQLAFFHFSIHEYLAGWTLAARVDTAGVWSAVTEYFRDGWWEEVLVFYAGIKRDVGLLIGDLHRHLTAGIDAHSERLRRLLVRWLLVADFTALDQIRPGRSVATALVALYPDLDRFKWQQYF